MRHPTSTLRAGRARRAGRRATDSTRARSRCARATGWSRPRTRSRAAWARTCWATAATAVDAAVATAFALAVTHPDRGQHRRRRLPAAPAGLGRAGRLRFPRDGPRGLLADDVAARRRSTIRSCHHFSHLAVGVPGTVAGLHLAWKEHGRLPWKRLVAPAIALAREGFVVSDELSRSLKGVLPEMKPYAASVAQFTQGRRALRDGRRRSSSRTSPARSSGSRTTGPRGSTRARRRSSSRRR